MTTRKLSGFAILSTEHGDLGVFATATAAMWVRTEATAYLTRGPTERETGVVRGLEIA